MKQCKLVISDEVNCKLTGLELSDRKTLVKMFEFEVPGARFLPSVRLGRWNGKTSYFALGGSTYINLLPEILPLLDQAGYDIELEDSRDYRTTFEFDKVSQDTFKHKMWPKGHPIAGQPIILRDYQIEIINRFLENPQSIAVAATGSGKTLITAGLSYSVEAYGRTIVIVPNQSLVLQTEEDYINMGLDVGVYFGSRKEVKKTHTICTWQSLNSLMKQTKSGEAEMTITDFIEGVVCVIVDEAHGIKADALKTLLTTFMAKIPIRWAMTGTIPKDGSSAKALEVCIGSIISELNAKDLQDQGILANCHVNIVQLKDSVEFKSYPEELKFLTTNQVRLEYISKLIAALNTEAGNALVLVDRIEAGEIIEKILTDLCTDKQSVVFLSGGTKLNERKKEYESITKDSNKIVIATYGIAAVGINIVNLNHVILIEPGKSFVRTIQSIGRGLRRGQNKDYVDIWDITSTCKFSKRHLSTRKKFYDEAKYEYSSEKVDYR